MDNNSEPKRHPNMTDAKNTVLSMISHFKLPMRQEVHNTVLNCVDNWRPFTHSKTKKDN